LFGVYLYYRLHQSLLAQVDTALEIAASQSLANLDEENGRPGFQQTENSQAVANRLSQEGLAVRLVAYDGTVWDGFGNYTLLPIQMPVVPGYSTLREGETLWRIYSQQIEMPVGVAVGWLQTAQSLESVQEALSSFRTQLLLGLPLVAVLAMLGGLFLAGRALRPIGRITRTAQAISGSDLSQRIRYSGPGDELGQMAAAFDRMLDRLQAAFRRERQFTADASHELRTPLTSLKGRIGVALNRERAPEEYRSTLRDLEREVDRLVRLSSDLLLLARLEQGHFHRQPEQLDLSGLLDAVLDEVRSMAQAKNITLVEEISRGLSIQGDPDHLIRLFLNLLDNACKYTPSGGRVDVRAAGTVRGVVVTISDTGPGIPPEHIPHLFERFYRVESGRSRDTGGAGLGLAIAYEIAHWHGGDLEAQSQVGQGTTFTVHLPSHPPGS